MADARLHNRNKSPENATDQELEESRAWFTRFLDGVHPDSAGFAVVVKARNSLAVVRAILRDRAQSGTSSSTPASAVEHHP